MPLFSKIIFTFISIFIFLFLIFFTYTISSLSSFEKPIYIKDELGLFNVHKNNDNSYILNSEISSTGTILLKRINISDEIFYSTGSAEPVLKENTIFIKKGIYLFNLRGISTNYNIKGEGFEINNLGVGMFIINTIKPKQNIIFSITSILDLNLKNKKTNADITSIDLFPNTYLLFNPSKNIFLKNSDLLKVSQVFTLDFFNKTILNNGIISEPFLNLVSLKEKESREIITNVIEYIKNEHKINNSIITNFLKSNILQLPSEEFINKYFSLFININKKNIYYKNIIIRDFYKTLSYTEINNNNKNNIIKNYKKLKEIDSDSAKEIEEIIISFFNNSIKSNKNINMKINIFNILKGINPSFSETPINSLLLLDQTFFQYNFVSKKDFFYKIINFKIKYIKDLSDINGDFYKIEKIDYFLFFIEKLLLLNYSGEENSIKDLIYILDDYVKISTSFYNYSDNKIKKTGIFKNAEILNNFKKNIRDYYFQKDRNSNGLLVIKENFSNNELSLFERNINKLIEFQKSNLSILKPKMNNNDRFLIKQYSILLKNFKEYFTALNDYNEYLTIYDKTKLELLTTNTINEKNITNSLSIDNAFSYLNQFNSIDTKDTNIEIMDYRYCINPSENFSELTTAYCYKIDNLVIKGISKNNDKSISFLLHPFQKHKIDEIVIKTKSENNKDTKVESKGSYKLDEIKIALGSKGKTTTEENDDKYTFENFLVKTFGEKYKDKVVTKTINKKEIKNENLIIEEEPIVKVFKRNKLLGKKGDFANLGGFLNIAYNDLIVNKNGINYTIKVDRALFNIYLSSSKIYYGEFSSNYNFAPILPSHTFINPSFKLIDKETDKYLLLGNSIYIKGKYKVNLIEEEIKEAFNEYLIIDFIVTTLSQELRENNIEIIYSKDSKELLFNLNYLNNKVSIKILDGNINKVTYKNKNFWSKKTSYKNLPIILKNITNQ